MEPMVKPNTNNNSDTHSNTNTNYDSDTCSHVGYRHFLCSNF